MEIQKELDKEPFNASLIVVDIVVVSDTNVNWMLQRSSCIKSQNHIGLNTKTLILSCFIDISKVGCNRTGFVLLWMWIEMSLLGSIK